MAWILRVSTIRVLGRHLKPDRRARGWLDFLQTASPPACLRSIDGKLLCDTFHTLDQPPAEAALLLHGVIEGSASGGPARLFKGGSSMIPAIGLMVGAYIITRMTAMLTQPGTSKVLKVLSLITIAVALVSCLDLLTGSAAIPPGRF
ncbi:hypothetical protein WJ978_28715 [Achromobacter xylosoxidans]